MIFQELSSLDGDKSWALYVDTSSHHGQVFAYDKKGVIASKTWGKEQKHDIALNESFQFILNQISLKDLKFIVCSYGPGSFTGLRVSATFCKVLSLSLGGLPIYGVSTFYSYAFEHLNNETNQALDEFSIYIPSIGRKYFKSTFKYNDDEKLWTEFIDFTGAHERSENVEDSFISNSFKRSLDVNLRYQSLSPSSPIKAHIQKSTYLDFYPLFLRRSEAEEKVKI